MKRLDALLFAFLLTGLIISLSYLASLAQDSPLQKVRIIRVIDGDTVVLENQEHVRLLNVNTPEKNEPNSQLAAKFLELYENQTLYLEPVSTDKYDRTLARVYTSENKYLNLELVRQGYAAKFLVDNSELKEFSTAEIEAIQTQKGKWIHSKFYGCVQTQIQPKDETVYLKSVCGKLNVTGWLIKDESRKTYIFPEFILTEATLHSKKGQDNGKDIFWNLNQDVWNNDRDTVYILDDQWRIVNYKSYGY